MKRILTFLVLAASGIGLSAQPQPVSPICESNVAAEYINIISRDKDIATSALGIMAVTYGGDTLAMKDSRAKLLPASNMKLISTGLALNELGPDFRFETKIAVDGDVVDGVLNGNVYIVGGGDPTIGSQDSIAVEDVPLFEEWYGILTSAGIKKINGYVIGDGRFFEGQIDNATWQYEDLGTYYGAGGDGLSFYINQQDISVAPGAAVGDAVAAEVAYPEVPWMRWTFTCTTGKPGTGDELYLYNTDLAPIAELRGTYGVDSRPKTLECSNKYGALTCAHYFNKFLGTHGLAAAKGVADLDVLGNIRIDPLSGETLCAAPHQDSLTVLGSTFSPSLKRIARITNYRSDNFYAETMYKIVGKMLTGSSLADSCHTAQNEAFERLGLSGKGIQVMDGSGLSRKNYISPEFFCSFLKAMVESGCFEDYLDVLGQPGRCESYAYRLANEDVALKDRIYMKSGSMNGVRCFSGYIIPTTGRPEDTIIFSIMSNNYTGSGSKLSRQIDKIIALLAGMN